MSYAKIHTVPFFQIFRGTQTPHMVAFMDLYIRFLQKCLRHKKLLNFNQKTHRVRYTYTIGSDNVTFWIYCLFYFLEFFFTTPMYFTPEFVTVPYCNGILQQYYGKYQKTALVTAHRIPSSSSV